MDIESPLIPIWVSFPNLRPHLFTLRILHGLGSLFGRPLRSDHATSTGTRLLVARVLVELDITKIFPDKVWLGSKSIGYIQCVVREDFSSYCGHCKALGHSKTECHIFNPNLTVAPVVTDGSDGVVDVVKLASNISNHLAETGPQVLLKDVDPVAEGVVGISELDNPSPEDYGGVLMNVNAHISNSTIENSGPTFLDFQAVLSSENLMVEGDVTNVPPNNLATTPTSNKVSDNGEAELVPYDDEALTSICFEGANASDFKDEDHMVLHRGIVDVLISVISKASLLPHLNCGTID